MNRKKAFLGIDSSNYTSSIAIIDEELNIISERKLLPVKEGERGLRQSDAVFHHTRQIPELFDKINLNRYKIEAIGVSVSPTTLPGSYMPCFLVGKGVAKILGNALNCNVYEFSHQQGHIAAALLSCDKLDLINKDFIAFHVSGGTTECVRVTNNTSCMFQTDLLFNSLDLKAGQAIDRIGVRMGFDFPCGPKLEAEALHSDKIFKIHPYIKNGDCSLSGLENQCLKMLEDGCSVPDISKYCFDFLSVVLKEMLIFAREKCGALPVVFSGGVMSNSIIRSSLEKIENVYFASKELSSDNAVGIAKLAMLRSFERK